MKICEPYFGGANWRSENIGRILVEPESFSYCARPSSRGRKPETTNPHAMHACAGIAGSRKDASLTTPPIPATQSDVVAPSHVGVLPWTDRKARSSSGKHRLVHQPPRGENVLPFMQASPLAERISPTHSSQVPRPDNVAHVMVDFVELFVVS